MYKGTDACHKWPLSKTKAHIHFHSVKLLTRTQTTSNFLDHFNWNGHTSQIFHSPNVSHRYILSKCLTICDDYYLQFLCAPYRSGAIRQNLLINAFHIIVSLIQFNFYSLAFYYVGCSFSVLKFYFGAQLKWEKKNSNNSDNSLI